MVNNISSSSLETAPMEGQRTRTTAAATSESAPLSRGLLPDLLGYRLRRAQAAVFEHFARTVGAEAETTPGLFGMLQVIAANPGLCQSRLAEAMQVDRSTIVAVIDRLEAQGLVARAPSRRDLRSYALEPTRKGRQALRRMEALVLRHEEEIAAALSPAERRTLLELLARLYQG
jgi:DNA-binding MarR family transcriptional regulator